MARHRKASAAAAVAALLLAVFAGMAWQQAAESAAQRARADAVRNFVFSMVADAEPAEGRADVSGREMVDAAAARARRDVQDPHLRGELLGELGRVYFKLQMSDASAATLEEAIALMLPLARPDDPALNRARAVLARTLLNRDGPRAATLAQQAVAACTRQDAGCADARAAAHYALAALASWRGENAAALEHSRALVEETRVSEGATSLAMAAAYETLATTARNTGRLDEATDAVERAQAIARERVMRAANRNRLDLLQAVIDLDMGRYPPARERLRALTQRPADDTERPVQWRLLSSAELLSGDAAAALDAASKAQRSHPPGPPDVETWAARQAWAVAASKLGRHAEALAAFDEAIAGMLAAGLPAQASPVQRAHRFRAEALLRQGSNAEAAAELAPLAAAKRADAIETARVLDALGCALARTGQPEEAAKRHAEAAALWAGAVPAAHPLRARNAALPAAADCSRLF